MSGYKKEKVDNRSYKGTKSILGEIAYKISFEEKQNFGITKNILKKQDKETLDGIVEVFPEKLVNRVNFDNEQALIVGFVLSSIGGDETLKFFKEVYETCLNYKKPGEAKEEINKIAKNYATKSLDNLIKNTGISITEDFKEHYIKNFSNYDFYTIIRADLQKNKSKEELKELLLKKIKKVYNEYSDLRKKEKDNYLHIEEINKKINISDYKRFDNFVNLIKEYYNEKPDVLKDKEKLSEELNKNLTLNYKIIEKPVAAGVEGKASILISFKKEDKDIINFEIKINYENKSDLDSQLDYYKNLIFNDLGILDKKPQIKDADSEAFKKMGWLKNN
jgi:hypothetical protein